ncbi:putative glycosyl transferase (Partial match) [Frankia sp. AiPs1]|uniref:glycosyltransferase family 2 protein n=1 Tax=Frankia sp. AiPa1 TaxID=573492 RepID=UPI00202B06CC|nr:glycosyltransferase family 2 protein [Frankia sp. AiPa1]MCL9760639.1 glycosyltransferase [Frankia sp. AiPa1]
MAYDYASFSTLAGPLQEPPARGEYHVAYRKIMVGRHLYQVLPQLIATVGLSSLFFVWLIQPAHYPHARYLPTAVQVGNTVMFWLIVVTEGIRLLNSITLCWSAFIMRNPIPVRPPTGLRVAFTTTIVPSKEPLDVVRDTLIAARNIKHDSTIDVWLLDEGNDPAVRAMCAEIGIHHFSRKGIERWNTGRGRFRAKTKHGNHNAWLDAHGDGYDVVLSVDPDHIPLPNFAERMLGYFRDPNVAFVVGPQVYGNFRHYLTRGAEAQNYMFHSVVQRAANRFACGMFVGTNHAYRVETWRQIGGFQDSITEDLATSFAVHGARNPTTRHRWTSVYTPDVIAVGEGPATWTDFFSQQLRWARGANEVLVTEAASRMRRLSWGPRLHYATLMLHYPTVALTWILGMMLTTTYMALGSTGVVVHVSAWLALYFDVFAARLLLYFWLRRFNTSPHEEAGSAGMSGIFVSVLCTPFYSTALVGAVFRRKLGFVVTPKGDQASPDRLMTFRKHLFWAAWSGGSITAAAVLGHLYPANMVWVSLSLVTCLIPIGLWGLEPILAPRRAKAPNPLPAAHVPAPRQAAEAAWPIPGPGSEPSTRPGAPAGRGATSVMRPASPAAQRRAAADDPVTEEVPAVVAAGFRDPVTEEVELSDGLTADDGLTMDTVTIVGARPQGAPPRGPAAQPGGPVPAGISGRDRTPAGAGAGADSAASNGAATDVDGPTLLLSAAEVAAVTARAATTGASGGRPGRGGESDRDGESGQDREHSQDQEHSQDRDRDNDTVITRALPDSPARLPKDPGRSDEERAREHLAASRPVRTDAARGGKGGSGHDDAGDHRAGDGPDRRGARPSTPPIPVGERVSAGRTPAAASSYAEQETVITARREELAGVGAAVGDQPAYVEDVTMRLTPRRRRVSLDGLLEELG